MIEDVEEAIPIVTVTDAAAEKIFDFTPPVESFDKETFNVYSRLRRAAKLYGGELPGGKVYTEAQVIEILGDDYTTGLVIDKRCCG